MGLLLWIALAVPAALTAQQAVDRKFPLDPDASIRIMSAAGRVRILGWDRDTLAVRGQIPSGGGSFYGGGGNRAAKLGVDPFVESGLAPGASLEVHVPHGARIWLKTVSGDVEVSGVDGEVDLLAVNGRLTVTGSPRVLTAETMDGAIQVDGAARVVRLRTGSGPVVVRAPSGDLSVTTVGGSVDAAVPRLERGRLETVSGALTYTGNLAPGAALELESHGGDVTLHLQGELNLEFDIAAVSGVLDNRLGLGPKGVARGKPVRFAAGSGNASVTIRTFKGRVVLGR